MRGFLSALGLLLVGSILFTSCLNSEPPNNEFEQQWIKDTTAIGTYVRVNGIPALKDASGIYFNILEAGSGFPKASSEVRFEYELSIIGSTSTVDESDGVFLADMEDLIPNAG